MTTHRVSRFVFLRQIAGLFSLAAFANLARGCDEDESSTTAEGTSTTTAGDGDGDGDSVGDGDTAGEGDSDSTGDGDACTTGSTASIASDHKHTMVVTQAEIDAGVDKEYQIQGTSMHPHTVMVSAADFDILRAGGTLTLVSSFDAMHTHDDVILSCG